MKYKLLIFILSVFILQTSFSQEGGKEVYIDKLNDFIISYPDNWDLVSNQEGIILVPPYPQEEFIDDEAGDSINRSIIEYKLQVIPSRWDEGDLDEFIDVNFLNANLTELFGSFDIKKEAKEKINGKNAKWYLATFNIEGKEMTGLFYFIKMFNRIISISAFCNTEDFELKYKIQYLEIIRSTKSYIENKGAR